MRITLRNTENAEHEDNASKTTGGSTKQERAERGKHVKCSTPMLGGGGAHSWVSSLRGWSPQKFALVPMGGDGRGLAAMTFSIPPRLPPPPHLLPDEGEVLQRVVLYAPSSVLRFLLFFLLITIPLLLVLALRFRVLLPGVPLMSLLAKGRLAFLGVLRARRSDPARRCKALHVQRGVRVSATHVLCAAFAAMCTSAPSEAANGDVDGVSRLRIATVSAAKEGPLPFPHAIRATAPF